MELIQGLHIDVSAAELKGLLEKRVEYHAHKTEIYERQLADLTKIDKTMADEAEEQGKYTNNTNAADAMKRTVKDHRDQGTFMKFLAAHIVTGATYRLAEADLQRIGVKGRGF